LLTVATIGGSAASVLLVWDEVLRVQENEDPTTAKMITRPAIRLNQTCTLLIGAEYTSPRREDKPSTRSVGMNLARRFNAGDQA